MDWYEIWVGNSKQNAIPILVLAKNEPEAVVKLSRFVSPVYIQAARPYFGHTNGTTNN